MILIKYESFELQTNVPAPTKLANKPFPYNGLADDRRFEELLYSIFKTEIDKKNIYGFNSISIMSGVRDKGRDCALFRNGKSYGVIQCKHYKNNLSKGAFGEEITKFVLYSLLDKRLINDPTDFKYFIAVSNGFARECSDFIDDFNELIQVEPGLHKWIQKNLMNPSLEELKLVDAYSVVLEKLKKIQVLKIFPQDIDIYLSKPYNDHLVSIFFAVHTVTDNTKVQDLSDRIDSYFAGNPIPELEVSTSLQRGSASLKFEKNEFDDIPDSHISRGETNQLFQWVINDVEKDKEDRPLNICLLGGNAGLGKTVILKDLYDKINQADIPVLGLKADKLYASNFKDLQDRIGLPLPLYEFIDQCKQYHTRLVVIIDQIDALSQSMSADRSFLNVYKEIIDNYNHDPNVRIIISVRIFDLNYDPSLRIYKNIKTFIVSPLEKNIVLKELSKIGIHADQVSIPLLSLLQIPNNLNIFSRIYKDNAEALGITTIQNLHTELWKQKVTDPPSSSQLNSGRLKKLLYFIAEKMFQQQRISVSEYLFEDYVKEIRYLESQLVIKRSDKQIQFFHQSFYDYTFSKSFVESELDLSSYIKQQDQSIFIRSSIKMIVAYQREYSSQTYISNLSKLLQDAEISFHIKHVLTSGLAFQEEPTSSEIGLVAKYLESDFELKTWFVSFINSPRCLAYYRVVSENCVARFIGKDVNKAWEFALSVNDPRVLYTILYAVDNWHDSRAYLLLNKCERFHQEDYYGYQHVLQKIAKVNIQVTLDKLKPMLTPSSKKNDIDNALYGEISALKILADDQPENIVDWLFEIISPRLTEETLSRNHLVKNCHFLKVSLNDNEELEGREFLYRLLAICLRRAAVKQAPEFKNFLEVHRNSKYEAILRLLIFAVKTNEFLYADAIFDLFSNLREVNCLRKDDDFDLEFRDLLQTGYEYLKPHQQEIVKTIIKHLTVKDEIGTWQSSHDKNKIWSEWGATKYAFLLRLPESIVNNDGDLKRMRSELKRRFPSFSDKYQNDSVMAGIVRAPLDHNAYSKMKKVQWIQSFKKYNDERDRFGGDFLKGGLSEHSFAFRDWTKENPSLLAVSIIEEIIGDITIHESYAVLGLYGLKEANADAVHILRLFKKILKTGNFRYYETLFISVAKYLCGEEECDEDILNFLLQEAQNYPDKAFNEEPFKEETSLNGGFVGRAINTAFGNAADALTIIKDKRFENKIFDAIANILQKGPKTARGIVYFHHANLNHLDTKRSFRLFSESLNKEDDGYLLACSLHSLQYIGNYNFAALYPAYASLVKFEKLGRDDAHMLLTILYASFIYDKPNAGELLFKLIDNSEHARTWALREASRYFYHNEDTPGKSTSVLMHVVRGSKKFQPGMLKLSQLKLSDVKEFISAYIQSPHFIVSAEIIIYLTDQCRTAPFDCIELFNLIMSKKANTFKFNLYSADGNLIIKFIVGAFSSLKDNDSRSKEQRKNLLQSFDRSLKDYRYRNNTEKVLENLLN